MAKKKLKRFAEVATFPNVHQHMQVSENIDDHPLRGKWRREQFKNDHPIVLELGCGKGEYTLGLAEKHPEKNFIGVDLKGARIWKGAKEAIEKKLGNVAFVRARIDTLDRVFDTGEADEIWITFPDPQPQKPRERKRLTSPKFINIYRDVLKPNGIVHLKTDNRPFWEYSLETAKEMGFEILVATDNLYEEAGKMGLPEELLSIRTYYENMFVNKGFDICYLKFRLG
jgi:tRNA (guanine-N7-)-methyltransferase